MPLPSFLFLMIAVLSTAGLTIWLMFLTRTPEAVVALIAVLIAAALQLINAVRHQDRPQKPGPSGH